MSYGNTFNQIGQILPPGLHIPVTLASFPYVPHPLQLSGHIPFIPVLGGAPVAGQGQAQKVLRGANRATYARQH